MLFAKLANKNHHFLKCYVRHMYMFRDPDPIENYVKVASSNSWKGPVRVNFTF